MTKEKAVELFGNLFGAVEDSQGNDYDEAFRMAIRSLKADMKPIVRGEWIKEGDNCVMGDGYMWFCSICGERVYFDTKGRHDNYCRCCGSDMRGEGNG